MKREVLVYDEQFNDITGKVKLADADFNGDGIKGIGIRHNIVCIYLHEGWRDKLRARGCRLEVCDV